MNRIFHVFFILLLTSSTICWANSNAQNSKVLESQKMPYLLYSSIGLSHKFGASLEPISCDAIESELIKGSTPTMTSSIMDYMPPQSDDTPDIEGLLAKDLERLEALFIEECVD